MSCGEVVKSGNHRADVITRLVYGIRKLLGKRDRGKGGLTHDESGSGVVRGIPDSRVVSRAPGFRASQSDRVSIAFLPSPVITN